MVRPSRRFGDLLLTYWAEAILLFPEEKEFPFPQERVCHLDPKTLLKIRLPLGVVGIGFRFDLRMSLNRHMCCAEEPALLNAALFVRDLSSEDPISILHALEVFLPYPLLRFVGVSSSGPLPKRPEDCLVYFRKRLLTDLMPVIRCPSSNHRVEDVYQVSGGNLLVCLDRCSNFL